MAAAVAMAGLVLAACTGRAERSAATEVTGTSGPSQTTTTTGAATSTVAAAADVAWPPARLEGVPSVDEVAAALTTAERTIVDPTSTTEDVERAGVIQQLLYRELAARTEIDDAVLAAVSDDVRPTIERVVAARRFVQARSAADPTPTPPSPTLPAWTIVDPAPVDELRALYDDAERLTGVPWYWLAAIHLQETRMGRVVGVSADGAIGPMQFLPTTWAECCTGDPLVTRDAIIGAATYLRDSGAPDDMRAAVYQYNPNEGYVALVTAYAENLRDQPSLLRGYHAWQVFIGSTAGTVRLPVGYSQAEPIGAAAYLADHPGDAA